MKTKRRLSIAGIVLGVLLTLAPIFGLLGSVFGMLRAFSTLGSSDLVDPKTLSDSIGRALLSTATGLVLCPLGIIILALSLVIYFDLRASSPPSLPPPTAP